VEEVAYETIFGGSFFGPDGLSARAAAPVVDGTLDASYGAPIAVQGVQTQFGDANPPGSSAAVSWMLAMPRFRRPAVSDAHGQP